MTASDVIEGPGFCVLLGSSDIPTVFFMFQHLNQHKRNSMSFHYCFSSYLKVKCCNLRCGKKCFPGYIAMVRKQRLTQKLFIAAIEL